MENICKEAATASRRMVRSLGIRSAKRCVGVASREQEEGRDSVIFPGAIVSGAHIYIYMVECGKRDLKCQQTCRDLTRQVSSFSNLREKVTANDALTEQSGTFPTNNE